MKKTIKVYLEPDTITQLENKSRELGITGRAWLSRYLERIAVEDLVFLDSNVRKLLRSLNLK